MIQRIQTLYLLASAILGFVCLALPLGKFFEQGIPTSTLYNLWITSGDEHALTPWALFAILLLVSLITLLNIMLYRKRALQMRVAVICMLLLVGWNACYFCFAYIIGEGQTFHPTPAAAIPLIMIILDYLAFRGIMKDELLVQSYNRLR